MRSLVISAAATALLVAAPAFARSNQSAPPSAGQSDNGGGTSSGKAGKGAGGLGLSNSSLFGVGIALAATAGIILATRDSSSPVSP